MALAGSLNDSKHSLSIFQIAPKCKTAISIKLTQACASAKLIQVQNLRARLRQCKNEDIPPPTLLLYHGGVGRVKEKLTRGLKKICEDFTQFHDPAALFEGFLTK